MYLHRYLRTTPVLAVLILVIVSLLKHLGSGPLFEFTTYYSMIMDCEKHWWPALLHIQNYYNPLEAVSCDFLSFLLCGCNFLSLQCLQASWYISADFQLVS